MVERQLPKLNVVGSIPIARSNPHPSHVVATARAITAAGCRASQSVLSGGGRPGCNEPMSEIATSDRSMPRLTIAVAAFFGVLVAVALALWAYYGTAVFTETILTGLAGCF